MELNRSKSSTSSSLVGEIIGVKSDLTRLVDFATSILQRVEKLESAVVNRKRSVPKPTSVDADDFEGEVPSKIMRTNELDDARSKGVSPAKSRFGSEKTDAKTNNNVDDKQLSVRDVKYEPSLKTPRSLTGGSGASAAVRIGTTSTGTTSAKGAASNASPPPSLGPDFLYDGDRIVVYTDGSCFNNGKSNAKGGIGVFWNDGCSLNVSRPLPGKQSNNRAELQAAVAAIRIAKERHLKKIQLRTDSGYVKMGITTWIITWKKNGWQTASKNPVKNVDDWKELDSMRNLVDVEWKWVEAHKGIHGNEMADQLANDGARKN